MSTTNFSNEPDLADGSPSSQGTSGDAVGAKEQAQQAAGTAKDEGKRVAGVAKDEAQSVVREAGNQARGLVDDATAQVDAQSKEQKDRIAAQLRTFGDDLHSMTAQGDGASGLAGQVVQQVADQARSVASHLEDREPRELLEDVRRFARRRPGTFLLGALVAGVVVGRVTRGAKDAQSSPGSPGSGDTPGLVSGNSSATASQPQTPGKQQTASSSPSTPGSPASTASTDLGPKGVEMSESGIVGPEGGRA
jgi:vacuolar-type H+-ATPase subunit H